MKRPKAMIEPNDAEERWEMYSAEPTEDHDGDGARQHIASIYDHEEAAEMLWLWNKDDMPNKQMEITVNAKEFKIYEDIHEAIKIIENIEILRAIALKLCKGLAKSEAHTRKMEKIIEYIKTLELTCGESLEDLNYDLFK